MFYSVTRPGSTSNLTDQWEAAADVSRWLQRRRPSRGLTVLQSQPGLWQSQSVAEAPPNQPGDHSVADLVGDRDTALTGCKTWTVSGVPQFCWQTAIVFAAQFKIYTQHEEVTVSGCRVRVSDLDVLHI